MATVPLMATESVLLRPREPGRPPLRWRPSPAGSAEAEPLAAPAACPAGGDGELLFAPFCLGPDRFLPKEKSLDRLGVAGGVCAQKMGPENEAGKHAASVLKGGAACESSMSSFPGEQLNDGARS